MVEIFYSDISQISSENLNFQDFCSLRQQYIQSISDRLRKKQSVCVWKLLLKALKLLDISFDQGFCVNDGKWSLVNSNYHFSLSHSNNIVVVAISDEDVGVDVEMFSEKLLRISKLLFPKQKIEKDKIKINILAKLWTKRECEIKNSNNKQKFYSREVLDSQGNKYVIGVISGKIAGLEQIFIG